MLHRSNYEKNLQIFYTTTLSQCSDKLKANLKDMENWDTIHNDHDMVNILKEIKAQPYGKDGPISLQLLSNHLPIQDSPTLT